MKISFDEARYFEEETQNIELLFDAEGGLR